MPKPPISKKQHYLPIVYLKQFAPEGSSCDDDSKVWKLSATEHALVSVRNECYERFGYSKTNPNEAESMFHRLEGDYASIMKAIWMRSVTPQSLYFSLICMIISVNLRNRSFENRTNDERATLYANIVEEFIQAHLLPEIPANASENSRRIAFRKNWRVRVIEANDELMTSDNPSFLLRSKRRQRVVGMLMPLTPRYCAIAYEQTLITICHARMTETDEMAVNGNQMLRCMRGLYANRKFTDDEVVRIREFFIKRKPAHGWVDDAYWSLPIWEPANLPSFVREI